MAGRLFSLVASLICGIIVAVGTASIAAAKGLTVVTNPRGYVLSWDGSVT